MQAIRVWLLLFGLMLPCLGGCANSLGRRVVQTPNHGKAVEQLDAHGAKPDMEGAVIDKRFYVRIDKPAADLSVWVIDPSNEVINDGSEGVWFTLPDAAPRQTREPDATILVLHGYRHWKNNWTYLKWARSLAQCGYRMVMVDLRGHGGSTGDWGTFGPQEAEDLITVVDELDRRGLLVGRLGVFGGSYGGTTALHLAGRDERVDAVVTVSAFATMRDVVPTFARAELGWLYGLVSRGLYNRIVDAAGRFGGFDPDAADARLAIAQTDAAVLLLHSLADRHVPADRNARELAAAGGERVELLLFENGTHYTFGVEDAGEVRRAAIKWFDSHLK